MAEVEEEEHKNFSGTGVYNFIQDLIVEGKDASFVNDNGCYAINWLTAPMRYHAEFKSRKDDITSSKASNNLRSALLNSYEKEGAKEYTECQKRNAQGKICERQFQMPSRIFALLFNGSSDMLHSDDSSGNEIGSIASQAGKSSQEAHNSSDTGFDEAMDFSCDDLFIASEEGIDFPIINSLLDNSENEEIYCDASGITTPSLSHQISFGISEDESREPLGDQQEVVESMFPKAGSIEGGLPFVITLTEKLAEDDTSEILYVADFDGVGVVQLEKFDPSTLSGRTPATFEPGRVKVTVMTQAGQLLGITSFLYVDHKIQEALMQLRDSQDLKTLYAHLCIEKHCTIGSDSNTVQILDPFDSFTMQDQAVAEDETDFKSHQSEDGDNQSDYFADVETSSCGSFELDAGWSDSDKYDGLCSKDETPKRKLSENSNSFLEGTSFEVPDEVRTQLGKDAENKNDDENYEEPSGIVNIQPSWNVGYRRNDWAPTTTSRQQGAYVEETQEKQALELRFADTEIELENKTSEGTSSRKEEEKACTSQELTAKPKGLCSKDETPKRKLSENSNSSLEGTSFKVPDEVRTQLGKDVENKNDDENYEEPSGIVNFQPSWNVEWPRNDWAYATTSRQQGAYVDETQVKESFTQSIVQGAAEVEHQTSEEDTSTREQEENEHASEEKTAKPKGSYYFVICRSCSEGKSFTIKELHSPPRPIRKRTMRISELLEEIDKMERKLQALKKKEQELSGSGTWCDTLELFEMICRIFKLSEEIDEMKRELEALEKEEQKWSRADIFGIVTCTELREEINQMKRELEALEKTEQKMFRNRWLCLNLSTGSMKQQEAKRSRMLSMVSTLQWKIFGIKEQLTLLRQEVGELKLKLQLKLKLKLQLELKLRLKLKAMAEHRRLLDVMKELAKETKRYAKLPGQLKKIDNEAAQQMAGEAYQAEERRGSEGLGLSLQEENQVHHKESETLIARAEECVLDWEAESKKLIEEVIMMSDELCSAMETLRKDVMEASTKEMNVTRTEEADENLQVTPSSSDTEIDEATDDSKDLFPLTAEPSSHYAVGDLPADDSPLDNIKTEEDQADPWDITTLCEMELWLCREEARFLELELESQQIIEEVIMINNEFCTQIKALLQDKMEASSKEMDERHTGEVTALLEKMTVLMDKMEKMKLSGDEPALHSTEKEEEEERVKIFEELPQL